MMTISRPLSVVLVLAAALQRGEACTNMLVSAGATVDGTTHVAYNADDGGLYGSLGHYPAADHPPGSVRDIWDWDGSFYIGSIPEVPHTYNVVGNTNEFGLTIGETTWGGTSNGKQEGAIMDYGSLIWVTLQRAKTAREAITVIDNLTSTYGYSSSGESFSIGDPTEVWLMEIYPKGSLELGAVWVASKVPDGYIGAHANQARTRKFALDDPENVRYAKDVVTFAQKSGQYPKSGKPEDFDFAAAYDPLSFSGARFCEARVWNIFQKLAPDMARHLDYAQGYNLTNPMPLFVKPTKKMAVNDTMWSMRTHFEGTWFDTTGLLRPDVGAGPGHSAYRARPLSWQSGGKSYVNERTVSVQQTGWNFVSQGRPHMPPPLASLFWWAPDESGTALRVPLYGGATRVPLGFADPVGQEPAGAVKGAPVADAGKMSLDSAFWVWNLVANVAYGERADVAMPAIQNKIRELEGALLEQVVAVDAAAKELYAKDPAAAVEYVTSYGEETGAEMLNAWRNFWMELFSMTRDFMVVTAPKQKQCPQNAPPGKGAAKGANITCTSRSLPTASDVGYDAEWYARIVADGDNAEHYAVPAHVDIEDEQNQAKLRVIHKLPRAF